MRLIPYSRFVLVMLAIVGLSASQSHAQCYGASQSVNELGIRLASVSNAASEGGIYEERKRALAGLEGEALLTGLTKYVASKS